MAKLFNVVINNGTAVIMVSYKSSKRLKLQIKANNQSIHYDIINKLIVPLTFNSGNYKFQLCEQVMGTKYSVKDTITKTIKLNNPLAYTTMPNSYINFNENSNFYKCAKELGTWENIWNYMIKNFQYDYIAALLNAKKTFAQPDIEKCFSSRKGICYDLSALMVAMARICNIPAILAIGTVNNTNHAWIIINDKNYDITKEL